MVKKPLVKLVLKHILEGGELAKHIDFIEIKGKRFYCKLCSKEDSLIKLQKHLGKHTNEIIKRLPPELRPRKKRKHRKPAGQLTYIFKCRECNTTILEHTISKHTPVKSIKEILEKLEPAKLKCPKCGREIKPPKTSKELKLEFATETETTRNTNHTNP